MLDGNVLLRQECDEVPKGTLSCPDRIMEFFYQLRHYEGAHLLLSVCCRKLIQQTLLNYGYTILRAATARALVSSGLLPAIGIFHHNRSNAFPLADDIMEPYRPYVDQILYDLPLQGKQELTKDVKAELIQVLYADTRFSKVTRPLCIGLSLTSSSLSKCYAKENTRLSLPILK